MLASVGGPNRFRAKKTFGSAGFSGQAERLGRNLWKSCRIAKLEPGLDPVIGGAAPSISAATSWTWVRTVRFLRRASIDRRLMRFALHAGCPVSPQ
jgi:hypothetical protein